MQNDVQNDSPYNDEIDFRELLSAIWAGKVKIIVITAIFAFVSVLYALSVPDQYRATALLAPAQRESGGLSGALQQLGGLASLAGVNIGGDRFSEAQIAQEIMKSWNFQYDFITKHNLAVEVIAVQGWNRETNKLEINDDLYDVESKTWVYKDNGMGPTSWQLFRAFSEKTNVSEGFKSGLVSVSIQHYSPIRAKQLLDMYVSAINEYMQMRKVMKINNNISYLEAQIEKTSIAEMQEVFYIIIEEQIKSRMLAEASPDYAFVTVSPAMVPEKKSQPNRPIICVLGTLLGGILSVLLVLVMHYGRKSDS